MKYSTKSAQYFKYFEDAKIIEIDNENKKLAIVLNGKDDVIDIFDASPYVDYNPFEYITKEDQNQNNINNNKTKGVVQIEEQGNNLDVNQIFDEIKNYKNIRFQKDSEENQDINRDSKSALIENRNKPLFAQISNQRTKKEIPAFSRIISRMNKENREIKKEKEKPIEKKKKYDILYISKFNIYYVSRANDMGKVNICLKKPKIQHRLLSVIQLTKDTVLGIKWFSFDNNKENRKLIRNMSIKDKYILCSKLLLVVTQEGCVSVYQLVGYEPFQITRVNLRINAMQTQPFLSFKEKYMVAASVKLSDPVLDYNLLNNSLENKNKDTIRLITLHINNSFTFWYIVNKNEKIELRIQYNFNLTTFKCENFLMDIHEEYLICFNKKGILIYLSKGQNFPYPIVYRYTFNDVLPPLQELKKIIYTNDVISDEEEQTTIKKDIKESKEDKENKETEGSMSIIMEKIEEIQNERKKKGKKKKNKENKEKKEEEKNEAKKEKENNEKNKDKEENKDKKKEEKKKRGRKPKGETKNNKNEEPSEETLIRFREYDEEEKEDVDDYEEDEFKEDDDFIVEGNPDFINRDEDIFLEDDKYLKFLQKPCFLSSGSKFLFVNYEVKSNLYSLYCFDFSELYQVEENRTFLETCVNQYEPNLITKIYSSKEKIYIHESPFYYFNPMYDDSIDKNLLNTINDRKKLLEQRFEFTTIVNNSYHGLFIRDGDYIVIIKININSKPNIELINNDIKSTKFLFYDQPTSENLKSNRLAVWTINNTLLLNSVDSLFNIIKFRNESSILGIAISKKKLVEYAQMSFDN